MTENEKLFYSFEFLYDNGEIESFSSCEMTENQLDEIVGAVYGVFQNGVHGVVHIPRSTSETVFIDVRKVTRLTVKELNENN